ncbi:NAD(P)/FAD-dependent oxidoreductase [Pseudomonadales bacterium]|jgi:cation diffusion facilitator CzcD-associated flavoprotein CzcO|nr:NAD(P)/FAD-dependent oxidoreductase [Pseudomonadales bacterium]MDA7771882.1 NAD(P)/FAD-dependent oxidoreductase [Pseudomonadales bacterium]MDC1018433.1 NAD(P)/FAD-dependent oxidoreductase [Pseudomonadales bacterium]|tara:strand:- start:149 stop:1975 length:1827 start_codon:yes stop_codon:yes gene_type:complete
MQEDVIKLTLGELDFDPDELKAKYLAERDKRLRDDGNEQYIEVLGDFSDYVDDPYEKKVAREPLNDTVEIVIIGGGFGGLLLGGRLREQGFTDIRVIEKGGDFGGTWYWNRYPGAMCDVESYCYLPMLEELDYIPKNKYSFAPEIMEHTQNIAKHYDLYNNACMSTEVTDMTWDEKDEYWIVSTNRGDRMRARYVAMANGPLNRPKLPGIPGIDSFKGHTFHTSRWDYDYTGGDASGGLEKLKDKKVGIIGTGATGVQCIPHLGEWSGELKVFQRTPSSVDVRNNRETDPEWAETLHSGWQYERMDNFNVLVSGGDQDQDLVQDGWTDIFRNLTGIAAKEASRKLGRRLTSAEKGKLMKMADYKKMNGVRDRVDEIIEDEVTAEALKPWYRQFCKRPCFHDEYLPTYNRPNVHLIDTLGKGVERVTEKGVVVDGVEHELDCLIFATGFEVGTSYTRRAGYDVTGKEGKKLSDKWEDGLKTLHGFTTNGFPNCFFLGFTQGAVTVNVPHALNEQAKHISHLLAEVRTRGEHTVEATPEGEQGWLDEVQRTSRFGERFRAECTPGYYNNEGKQANPNGFFTSGYGGGPIKFFRILEQWRENGTFDGVKIG